MTTSTNTGDRPNLTKTPPSGAPLWAMTPEGTVMPEGLPDPKDVAAFETHIDQVHRRDSDGLSEPAAKLADHLADLNPALSDDDVIEHALVAESLVGSLDDLTAGLGAIEEFGTDRCDLIGIPARTIAAVPAINCDNTRILGQRGVTLESGEFAYVPPLLSTHDNDAGEPVHLFRDLEHVRDLERVAHGALGYDVDQIRKERERFDAEHMALRGITERTMIGLFRYENDGTGSTAVVPVPIDGSRRHEVARYVLRKAISVDLSLGTKRFDDHGDLVSLTPDEADQMRDMLRSAFGGIMGPGGSASAEQKRKWADGLEDQPLLQAAARLMQVPSYIIIGVQGPNRQNRFTEAIDSRMSIEHVEMRRPKDWDEPAVVQKVGMGILHASEKSEAPPVTTMPKGWERRVLTDPRSITWQDANIVSTVKTGIAEIVLGEVPVDEHGQPLEVVDLASVGNVTCLPKGPGNRRARDLVDDLDEDDRDLVAAVGRYGDRDEVATAVGKTPTDVEREIAQVIDTLGMDDEDELRDLAVSAGLAPKEPSKLDVTMALAATIVTRDHPFQQVVSDELSDKLANRPQNRGKVFAASALPVLELPMDGPTSARFRGAAARTPTHSTVYRLKDPVDPLNTGKSWVDWINIDWRDVAEEAAKEASTIATTPGVTGHGPAQVALALGAAFAFEATPAGRGDTTRRRALSQSGGSTVGSNTSEPFSLLVPLTETVEGRVQLLEMIVAVVNADGPYLARSVRFDPDHEEDPELDNDDKRHGQYLTEFDLRGQTWQGTPSGGGGGSSGGGIGAGAMVERTFAGAMADLERLAAKLEAIADTDKLDVVDPDLDPNADTFGGSPTRAFMQDGVDDTVGARIVTAANEVVGVTQRGLAYRSVSTAQPAPRRDDD